MFYVYALFNKERSKIYIGHTQDLKQRLERHNNLLPNKKKSYTSKNSGLWIIVYKEKFNTRSDATLREKELKSFRGRQFVKNLIQK